MARDALKKLREQFEKARGPIEPIEYLPAIDYTDDIYAAVKHHAEAHTAEAMAISDKTERNARLTEIEAAVDGLPPADKERLLLFLAARLRAQAGQLPPPRKFSPEQMQAWVAEDESDMQRFRDSNPR